MDDFPKRAVESCSQSRDCVKCGSLTLCLYQLRWPGLLHRVLKSLSGSPAERLFPAGIYVERRGELVWGFSDRVDPELPRVSYLNQEESRMLTVGQSCHLTEFQA